MRINHNVTAMSTSNNLYNVNNDQSKVLEKLGSGQRINRASDDSAGLAISEKIRGEIAVLKQSRSNQQDLIAFTNAQDGTLNEISNILVNLQQLIVQSGDGWSGWGGMAETGSIMMNTVAIGNIYSSIKSYTLAMQSFLKGSMNGISLLSDESLEKVGATDENIVRSWIFHDGTTGTTTKGVRDLIEGYLTHPDLNGAGICTLSGTQIVVDALNSLRASIGAKSNQAEATVRNLATQIENLTDSESRIKDTDMAEMTVDFQKNNILNNAATAMLAQANTVSQSVLTLLR